ncbi:MAG: prepilin-type N-terminal cleavage/methylation domain-containing protein [Nitrospirae bacterium]|nr:prepilin-type N-terminal cleavage/methylation domain-containing protein [Nitrospirota bacterium]
MNAHLDKYLDNGGFSLVEAMVSMVILTIVTLGLLQTIILVNDANMKNFLRDEGVKVGQEDIDSERLLAKGTGDLSAIVSAGSLQASPPAKYPCVPNSTGTVNITRQFKNATITFNICRSVTPAGTGSVRLDEVVTWLFKNETFSYVTTTIIRPLS